MSYSISPSTSSSLIMWIALALFLASIGNPIYAVANQTAILEAADTSNRGSVMATRFGLVQTASIIGVAAGGLITQVYGPLAAYGVLGVDYFFLPCTRSRRGGVLRSTPWRGLRGGHSPHRGGRSTQWVAAPGAQSRAGWGASSSKALTGFSAQTSSSYCGDCVTCVRAPTGPHTRVKLRSRYR